MPATTRALRQCRSMRTASVLMPRSTRKQSKGPGTAPAAFWTKASASARAGSSTATKPPRTSEWPPRYLVVEWTTASAPSSRGRWRNGVANVLSTTHHAFRWWAKVATAAMSAMASIGLVGVSTHTRRVSSRHARSSAPGSARSAAVNASPAPSYMRARRWVPPYASLGSTTWSPGRSRRSSASSAAMPDAKASPWPALSSDARQRSSAVRVGLAVREYS